MNYFKAILANTTGYWLHKISTLPIGADIFVDIRKKIEYPSLDVIFDVGANIGQARHWFRFHLPRALIYSFEPVVSVYEQLKKNGASDKRCIMENLAFGDLAGEKVVRLFDDHTVLNSLREDLMNNSANAREEIIKVETLDNYCRKSAISKIDLLKIDTEGYELPVLEGAKELLGSAKISFIYCETGFVKRNIRNTYFAELTEWLAARDYYFFGLYQMDTHDWQRGNYLGNALYVHRQLFNP